MLTIFSGDAMMELLMYYAAMWTVAGFFLAVWPDQVLTIFTLDRWMTRSFVANFAIILLWPFMLPIATAIVVTAYVWSHTNKPADGEDHGV